MGPVEYSDYYKFVVSVGIALIIVALALPWAFLREPFDLSFDTAKISSITPQAKALILQRQGTLLWVWRWIPWLTGLLLASGVYAACFGLWKWRARQLVRDRAEDAATAKAERELQGITPEQNLERVRADAEAATPEQTETETVAVVDRHRRVEDQLTPRIVRCFSDQYDVRINQRLGAAEYDIVLRSRTSGQSDIVIDWKLIRRGFKYGFLREASFRAVTAAQLYRETLSRPAISVLLLVLASDGLMKVEIQQLDQRIKQALLQLGADVKIEYVSENALAKMTCGELKSVLLG